MDMTTQDRPNQPAPAPVNVGYGRITLVALLFALFFGGVLLAQLTPLLLPPPASAEAQNVDQLFSVLLMIGGMVFLLVQGLLVYSVLKFRAKPDDTSDGPPIHGNATLEIVWTIIPALIVIVLAILSFIVWDTNTAPKDGENLVNGTTIPTHAVGQRFAWTFTYSTPEQGPEGDDITLTSDTLHTYVGQNVALTMETSDVIHSFWVPAMRVKQDLLPGRTTEVRFTPVVPPNGFEFTNPVTGFGYNEYPIVCTELCGSGHGQMVATLVVHENEEAYLANFYDDAIFAAQNPPDDPVLLGETVLTSGAYPCSNCHALDSFGWDGVTGPTLNGIGARAGERVSGLSAVEYLAQSIRQPNAHIVAGYSEGIMNYFGPQPDPIPGQQPYAYMPQEDLNAIIAYLCTETGTGDLADSACALDYADDGTAADAQNMLETLTEVTDQYE